MAKRKSQSDHDNMVDKFAMILAIGDYQNIRSDVEGWDTPRPVPPRAKNQHIPDITCNLDVDIIIEVETTDSIQHDHTKSQWEIFSNYSSQLNGEFWVVVPKGSENLAEQRLRSLGLNGIVKSTE